MFFGGAERSSKKVKAVHYIGVRKKLNGGFGAEIRDRAINSRMWLGTFKTAVEAARAYDEAARALRGPRAKTNFPLHSHSSHSITTAVETTTALERLKAIKAKAKANLSSAYHGKPNATKPWTHAYLTRHSKVGNAKSDLASCDSQQLNHSSPDINSQENLAKTNLSSAYRKRSWTHAFLASPRNMDDAKTNLSSACNEESIASNPWTHYSLTRHRNVGNAKSDLAASDSQQLNHDSADINGASSSSTVIDKLRPFTSSEHERRCLDLNFHPPAEDEEVLGLV